MLGQGFLYSELGMCHYQPRRRITLLCLLLMKTSSDLFPLLGFYSNLFLNVGLGIIGLTLVLIFHGGVINRVLMRFDRFTKKI